MMKPDYYDIQYQKYFEKTITIDPSLFLSLVTNRLDEGAAILDIGCGSGRDMLWLRQRGFRPTGFEKSAGLAALARMHSGCPVMEGDFSVFNFSDFQFDAVLLIGAFVHLRHAELAAHLVRVGKAIRVDGLLYLSLKEGTGCSETEDSRVYSLWRHEELEGLFESLKLTIIDFSRNESALDKKDVWLGYLLKNKQK
jgi:SAM-dependent methyltransferase